MKLKGFRDSPFAAYQSNLTQFFSFFQGSALDSLAKEQKPREYYNITRPKKSRDLPNVLSQKEVVAIINQPKNIKHKAILYTIYSAGLRLGEILCLRVIDIRSQEGFIFLKDSKGKKDRHTVLSPIRLNFLRAYFREYKPFYWLFEGQDGGQYPTTSIQEIFRRAFKDTGSNIRCGTVLQHI